MNPSDYTLSAQGYHGGARYGIATTIQLRLTALTALPPWADPVARQLGTLLQLTQNWDSYGALPLDQHIVRGAVRLLAQTMHDETPAPSVVPTNRGGIQLEWHVHDIDLEIEILSPSKFDVYFRDDRLETGWDEEMSADLRPLRDAIDELTRRARAAR